MAAPLKLTRKMPTISLCMIVRDEEDILERHLRHIKDYVDEIIIVDTGSKDKTKEIAKKFTNKVYDFKWCDDFSKARNFSLSKATKEWILVLDADAFVEKPRKLKEIIAKNEADIYIFKRLNAGIDHKKVSNKKYVSKKLKESYIGYQNRLFKSSLGISYMGIVHERPVIYTKKKPKAMMAPMRIFHLSDINKPREEYYANLCKIAIKNKDFNCNIIHNLLGHYISKKQFKLFNEFFEKTPYFVVEKEMRPFMLNLVVKLKQLNKTKEAEKLTDVLNRNISNTTIIRNIKNN